MLTPKNSLKTVCVVGLGYIGLPTAVFFARAGYQVIGVDVNARYVEAINNGTVPFYEPDFESLLTEVVGNGHLRAQEQMPEADAYIVAVPTPFAEGYKVDDSYILAAARSIAPVLRGGELVILESTSPPKTTEHMIDEILRLRPDLTTATGEPNTIYAAHCPERVLPGYIVKEMVSNDRVIGGTTPEASQMAGELYGSFCQGQLHLTDATTAEMAKLAENSFRDVNIAYANELSLICDELDISVWELIRLANYHPRVNILAPGPGVGGHCIAVDPWFIVSSAPSTARLIRTAREVNDSKPQKVLQWVDEACSTKSSPVIAVLGVAFKPDIDDLRESPALAICGQIADTHVESRVLVVEPNVAELPAALANRRNVELVDLEAAIDQAEVVVLLVDHAPFKEVEAEDLEGKAVVDTKGLWRAKPVTV